MPAPGSFGAKHIFITPVISEDKPIVEIREVVREVETVRVEKIVLGLDHYSTRELLSELFMRLKEWGAEIWRQIRG